jgi:aldose 1-epimerase
MKNLQTSLVVLTFCTATVVAGGVLAQKPAPTSSTATHTANATEIGGAPVVTLKRPVSTDRSKPHLLEATILPGRGMNLLQIKAYLPGKGEVNLIHSPGLDEVKKYLDTDDNEYGYNAFRIGGAILLPWANRIRGTASPDGKTIQVKVGAKTVSLPAGWSGNKPGAEKHAIHGLLLKARFENVQQQNSATQSTASGIFHAGDFNGQWPSQTDVTVRTTLSDTAVEVTVTAKNVGKEDLPMSIGMHPYFEIPSGDRKQVRLRIPSESRAEVNNADDVFPTGKLLPLKGTPYDFSAPGGKILGDMFLDDNFLNLKRGPDGVASVEITDPAAHYGMRIKSLSPQVKAFQVYAPPDKNFVAVEPQFNLNDPFNAAWGNTDTGMVTLHRGQSVSWKTRFEVFTPAGSAK